jgi:hypothetical protein
VSCLLLLSSVVGSIESAITGKTHHAISDDCERRENTGVESYRDAADRDPRAVMSAGSSV